MDEYIPRSMTDEQALKALKSAKFTMERGSAKSIFRYGLMEAMCHAIKALEEKVENEKGQTNMSGTLYCEKACKWCAVANTTGIINVTDSIDNIYAMSGRRNGKTQYILDQLKKSCNTIKDVIFNDPATIVFWTDGSKTIVKCQEGETFDPEKGLAMAISKKMFGNNYGYYEIFAKYIGRYNKKRFNEALEEAKKIPPDEIVRDGVVYRRVEDGTNRETT